MDADRVAVAALEPPCTIPGQRQAQHLVQHEQDAGIGSDIECVDEGAEVTDAGVQDQGGSAAQRQQEGRPSARRLRGGRV